MEAPKPETIPVEPGVYLYKDKHGRILYVGKAKCLRKRVASYFGNPERLSPKTRAMLSQAARVDTLTTGTEKEALLTEASLIKKHRPRYNIVLRDDKQYILFKLDKGHDYPRLVLTRRVVRDGSLYYGPYTSAHAAREAWKAIHRVFPLRRCKDASFRNRTRPCLYHHMGSCPAPCVLPVPVEDYARIVKRVELLLSGRSGELTRQLAAEMETAAENLEFERAAELRDQIRAVERTLERQTAVLSSAEDMDVIGLAEAAGGLALALLFIRQGKLLDKQCFFWPNLGLEEGPEALAGFLAQHYGPHSYIPPRILLPWPLPAGDEDDEEEGREAGLAEILSERRDGPVRLTPPRGDIDKRLVNMARQNARQDAALRESPPILPLIQAKLRLPRPPERIEIVDISHIQGHKPVAGMVVFLDGKPAKSEYRLYKLDELEGLADDYASLAAFATRRAASGPPWPDLLLIDGGRGQLGAVERALREVRVRQRAGDAGTPPAEHSLEQPAQPPAEPAPGRREARLAEPPDEPSIGPSVEPPVDPSVGPPVEPPVGSTAGLSVEPPVESPVGSPVESPVGQALGAPVGLSVGPPAESAAKHADGPADGPGAGLPGGAPVGPPGERDAAPGRQSAQLDVARPTELPAGVAQPTGLQADVAKSTGHPADAEMPTELPADAARPTELQADDAAPLGVEADVAPRGDERDGNPDALPVIPLAGIAKAREDGRTQRRHGDVADQIFLPGRKNPVNLDAGSSELLFLQHMRDTAHAYVLGRHRKARSKSALAGELQALPGVGPKTARLLWDRFPNLAAMSEASEEELAAIPGLGRKKAAALREELRKFKTT